MDDTDTTAQREALLYKDCVRLPEDLNDQFFNALDNKDTVTVSQILDQHPEAARARDYETDIISTRLSEDLRSRALDIAAAKMPPDIIEKMIDLGAAPAAAGPHGSFCLHIAALNNRLDIIDLLLDKGAKIEALNNDGETPFHRALVAGQLDAAKKLLARGAQWNKTPDQILHLFLLRDHHNLGLDVDFRKVIFFLVKDHGAQPDNKAHLLEPALYSPPLHTAIVRQRGDGCVDAALALLQCGANPNSRDSEGNTPLHRMALSCRIREYNFPVIQMLLEYGANPALHNDKKQTVLDLCRDHNRHMLDLAGDMIVQQEKKIHAEMAAKVAHGGTKAPVQLIRKIRIGR